jgi:hypothetical protein
MARLVDEPVPPSPKLERPKVLTKEMHEGAEVKQTRHSCVRHGAGAGRL